MKSSDGAFHLGLNASVQGKTLGMLAALILMFVAMTLHVAITWPETPWMLVFIWICVPILMATAMQKDIAPDWKAHRRWFFEMSLVATSTALTGVAAGILMSVFRMVDTILVIGIPAYHMAALCFVAHCDRSDPEDISFEQFLQAFVVWLAFGLSVALVINGGETVLHWVSSHFFYVGIGFLWLGTYFFIPLWMKRVIAKEKDIEYRFLTMTMPLFACYLLQVSSLIAIWVKYA